eukprot:scaffold1898_cov169-Ochromonas_danica.AAC.2
MAQSSHQCAFQVDQCALVFITAAAEREIEFFERLRTLAELLSHSKHQFFFFVNHPSFLRSGGLRCDRKFMVFILLLVRWFIWRSILVML